MTLREQIAELITSWDAVIADRGYHPEFRSGMARCRDLLASLDPRQDETGWRSMDSAPKDGTEVLITTERAEPNGTLRLVGEAYYHDPDDGDVFGDTGWWWANTSWGENGEKRIESAVVAWRPMPLPAAPSPRQEPAEKEDK